PLFRYQLLSPAALRVAVPPLALNGASCLRRKNVEEGPGRRPGVPLIPSPEVVRLHASSRTPRPPQSAAPRPRPCKPPSRSRSSSCATPRRGLASSTSLAPSTATDWATSC